MFVSSLFWSRAWMPQHVISVVNLIVRIVVLQFCGYYKGMDQSEEEKYFLLLRYWLKSKGTFPFSL
jgi:hypothetical protein